MRTIRGWVCFIFCVALFQPLMVSAQGQEAIELPSALRFERLTVEDGLANATVLSVLQDRQGFLWFATANGLSRYDGISFKNFYHDKKDPHSLSDNNVFCLVESRDGLIWVGTDPGGLNVFDPQTGKFRAYRHDENNPNSLPDDSVWSLLEAADGSIWVGTRNGLSHLDRTTETFTNYLPDANNPHALAAPVIYRIYQDRSGTIWVATRKGLHRYNPQTDDFTIFAAPDNLSHSNVWAILEDSQGVFWVGTRGGGLNRFDRETGAFEKFMRDPTVPGSISDDRIWNIYEDRDGRLWVLTEYGGLNLFDRQTQTFTSYQYDVNDPLSLSGNDIYWMTQDRSGVLWIASRYAGVSKLDPSVQRFGLYRSIPGNANSLSASAVYAFLVDPDGLLWIGTFGGGLNRIDRKTGQVTVFRYDAAQAGSLSNNRIYNLYLTEDGLLWVATAGGGLNVFDRRSGRFYAYQHVDGDPETLATNFLTKIAPAGKNRLWIGTLGYGVELFNTRTGEVEKLYKSDPQDPTSLSEDTIYDMEVDSQGQVWLATARGGLEKLDPQTGKFTHHRASLDGLLSDTVHALYLDEERGIIWAATSGGLSGLELTSGVWHSYTVTNGLPSDMVVGVEAGEDGQLWLSTGKGLSRFDPQTEQFFNYDVRDGLQGDQFEINSSYRAPDGELFFGGSNGATFFYPQKLTLDPFQPPVVFTGFDLFNQPVVVGGELLPQPIEQTEKITLRYDQSVFTVRFAALGHSIATKNRYQHQLVGFDKDWQPPSSRQEVTYTNLAPGKYTLLVRAANHDGVWSNTPAALRIEVTPPWWRRWWFYLLAGVTLALAVFGGVQWRLNQVRAINIRLEKEVTLRTLELQAVQEQLLQANAGLQEKLNAIMLLQQQLREQAVRDALTGLYNRRFLSEWLERELQITERKVRVAAFLLLDIDHFKQINDTYGHHTGDAVLIALSRILDGQVRVQDVVCRYGGEEFMVVLQDITAEDALKRAEEIRQQIEALRVQGEDGREVRITVSIGVACYPVHGSNMDQIFCNVDRALYQAKEAGRNRVVIFNPL